LNRCRYGRNDVIPSTLFSFNEDTSGHTKSNAMWMAELSALAYHDEDYVEKQLKSWGYGDFIWITSPESENTDTVAFLATGPNHVVISFRGTSSLENLITDLTFSKVDSPYGRGKIHRGFMKAYASVQIALNSAVDDLGQGHVLFVTGHSLGAALAQLAAYDLAAKGNDVAAVYVFGSPRVGNKDFASAYNQRLEDRTFLHINNKDLVTRVPPEWILFQSLGKRTNHFIFDEDHALTNDMIFEDSAPESIQYDSGGEVILTDNVKQQLQDSNQRVRNVIAGTTRYLNSPVNLEAPSYQTDFDTGPADDHGINQYLFKFACSIVDDKWSSL
jgi:hypothetical protein